MNLNIDDIAFDKLGMDWGQSFILDMIKAKVVEGKTVSDDMLGWLVYPPVIVNQTQSPDEEKIQQRINHEIERKERANKIVTLVKREFYDLVCKESDYYKKERSLLTEPAINAAITAIATAIATKLGVDPLKAGTITAIVTALVMVMAKMSKKVVCELIKSTEEQK